MSAKTCKPQLMFQVTKRPFIKSKTNFQAVLFVQCYFPKKKMFLPIFAALLQNQGELKAKKTQQINEFLPQAVQQTGQHITIETYTKAI